MHPIAQSDIFQSLPGPFPAFVRGHPGVNQRQFHVMQRIRARQQIESLEDKTNLAIANRRQFVVGHRRDILPVELVAPGRRRIEAAEHVHQRRLAAARWTHDRKILVAARSGSRHHAARE